jgi:hypothetical protein
MINAGMADRDVTIDFPLPVCNNKRKVEWRFPTPPLGVRTCGMICAVSAHPHNSCAATSIRKTRPCEPTQPPRTRPREGERTLQ